MNYFWSQMHMVLNKLEDQKTLTIEVVVVYGNTIIQIYQGSLGSAAHQTPCLTE